MKGTWGLAINEFRLNLRDPLAVFWTLGFPTLWLVMMAGIIATPIPGFGYDVPTSGYLYMPAGISLTILCSSFVGLPLVLSSYRETGVLKRLRATPVKSWSLVVSISVSQLLFITLGIVILAIVSRLFFDVRILGSVLAFIGVMLLGVITFLALGSAIGSIASSFKTANIIIWSAFTPMLMLSELFMPLSILPKWLQTVAKLLPLTPINTLLRDIVCGVAITDYWRFGVIAFWIALSCYLVVRHFRWE